MANSGGDDQDRRIALVSAVRVIAADLLRESFPNREAVGLLQVAMVAAVLAGDRDLLRVLPPVIDRFERYAPHDQEWSQFWLGQLAMLRTTAELGEALLGIEARCHVPES
jgi:hypothetical protein